VLRPATLAFTRPPQTLGDSKRGTGPPDSTDVADNIVRTPAARGTREGRQPMSGAFIELTESETSRPMLFNTDQVVCVAPHGRGGSFVYVTGTSDRFEVEETPTRVIEILKTAGLVYSEQGAEQ
jgi:hypothetical protein